MKQPGEDKQKLTHSFPQQCRYHSSLWLPASHDEASLFPHCTPEMTTPTLVTNMEVISTATTATEDRCLNLSYSIQCVHTQQWFLQS